MIHLLRLLVIAPLFFLTPQALASLESKKEEFSFDLDAINRGTVPVQSYNGIKRRAQEQYQLALRTNEELDDELFDAVHIYALVIRLTQPVAEAKKTLNAMLVELEKRFGADTFSASLVLMVLGGMESGQEQVEMFQRALRIHYAVYPRSLESYATVAKNMADIYIYKSKLYDQGLQMLGIAFPAYEQEFGSDSVEVMWLHLAYGHVFAQFNSPELANASLDKALAVAERVDDPALSADVWFNVGVTLAELKVPTGASDYFERAISGFEATAGVDTMPPTHARLRYAQHLQNLGSHSEAAQQLNTARAFFDQTDGFHDMEFDVLQALVEVYEDLGLRDKATEYCLAISQINVETKNPDYQPVLKRAPNFPVLAPGESKVGYVIVEYTVDEQGFVQSPKIVESTGSEAFHAPSLEASFGFRYAPRIRDGVPVAVPGVRNKFNFKSDY